MTLEGWSRTDGYAALEPSKSLDYFQLPALRVSSTRWVHRSPSTSAIEGLAPYDENWMQVPDPLPLVRLVTHVVPSATRPRTWQRSTSAARPFASMRWPCRPARRARPHWPSTAAGKWP